MKLDIHDTQRKLIRCEERLEESDILPENKKLIKEFKQYLRTKDLSDCRILKYCSCLMIISKLVPKPFREFTHDDIYAVVNHVRNKGSAEWTKLGYNAIMRGFFRWLSGNDKEYPDIVKNLRTRMPQNQQQLPNQGDLITENEVKKLLEFTKNQRDKAFVSVLWESGTRIAEILTLNIKDVSFDKFGGFITVIGKTGSRKIRLVSSIPYLANWLESHPCKRDRNAPLWVCLHGKNRKNRPVYRTIAKILTELFEDAGIKKRCNPHSFRHARATYLANHLTEFQMNQYFGWKQGGAMAFTYVHLSSRNTDAALLKIHGIDSKTTEEKSDLKPRVCDRCEQLNAHNASYCCRCGFILDKVLAVETALKEQELVDKEIIGEKYSDIFEDKEILSLILKKIKARKLLEMQVSL
ncbi:TPA: tyrosine-type recombinase/integrase [Candidatus Woesearchaeota archaeon]|nr:tyrosine-type recombinase/integrase [Candidatus Woesearchaeota archaeon]